MLKILISNDDGIHAEGLAVLAQAISTIATVKVVAPDRDRSAVSNSLTIDMPIRVTEQPNGFYSVQGTPTDAVHLAITGLLDEHPDMIVAGINSNENLGDDVLYSGTVAAAIEGRFLGYPAMAISLVNEGIHEIKDKSYYDTAAQIAIQLIQQLISDPLPLGTILNVNVPNKPLADIKGIKVTRLGNRHKAENVVPATDQKGRRVYWVGPAGKAQDSGPGTDFHAVEEGYVSISPIKTDLTDHKALEHLSEWTTKLKI